MISMWFLQIIESVLNLEVMKLDFFPLTHTSTTLPIHTHTHSSVLVCLFFFCGLLYGAIAVMHFAVVFLFLSVPWLLLVLFLNSFQAHPPPQLLLSKTS